MIVYRERAELRQSGYLDVHFFLLDISNRPRATRNIR